MGSFSDLVICPKNGYIIEKQEVNFVSEELIRLGNEVLKTTDKLRKELRQKKLL